MRVLIAGHWQTRSAADLYQTMRSAGRTWDGEACNGQPAVDVDASLAPTTAQAHDALSRGIRDYLPDTTVDSLIFGAGDDFPDALAANTLGGARMPTSVPTGAQCRPGALVGVTVPRDCVDAAPIGRRVNELLAQGCLVAIEGGHNGEVSLWASFLEGALGLPAGTLLPSVDGVPTVDEAALASSLDELRSRWAGKIPSVVTATQRPLVGLMSVMAIAPDLTPRLDTSTNQALALRRVLAHAHQTYVPSLPLVGHDAVDPASLPGAGAGGGIGAMVAALGGAVHDCGRFLASRGALHETVAHADLLIVTEPTLHSPHLAEACLDTLTHAAAELGIPAVAVGIESTLSRHERAQWGLHGALLSANSADALYYVGQRLAHTWLRRG